MIKTIRYILHYFFGKHKWTFRAKTFKSNEDIGHKEDSYIFECTLCHKQKVIEVVDEKA